jgi:small subunit ribosomal protein S3
VGQKVHPIGFRLGINKTWASRWYAKKEFGTLLQEDLAIRKYLKKKLSQAGFSKAEIERATKKIRINIFTSRPGMVIGRKGAEIDQLKKELQALTDKEIYINIHEVKKPEVDAQLVAENIALQLERRVSFRRAIKKSVSTALKLGALGIKVSCAGRLGGAEIARREWYREGSVPLHTLRAHIDYGVAEALTTYGLIGVKVWVNRDPQSITEPQKEKKGF